MIHRNIFFQDFKDVIREELFDEVKAMLVADGWVARDENDPDEAFEERLNEEADHYINTHNFAAEYML